MRDLVGNLYEGGGLGFGDKGSGGDGNGRRIRVIFWILVCNF